MFLDDKSVKFVEVLTRVGKLRQKFEPTIIRCFKISWNYIVMNNVTTRKVAGVQAIFWLAARRILISITIGSEPRRTEVYASNNKNCLGKISFERIFLTVEVKNSYIRKNEEKVRCCYEYDVEDLSTCWWPPTCAGCLLWMFHLHSVISVWPTSKLSIMPCNHAK